MIFLINEFFFQISWKKFDENILKNGQKKYEEQIKLHLGIIQLKVVREPGSGWVILHIIFLLKRSFWRKNIGGKQFGL